MTRPFLLVLALAAFLPAGCATRNGDDLALNGNLAGAMEVYAKEDTYDSHLKMGMLHQTQGDHHDAIAQFTQAIPRNAEADYRVYQYRAESYLSNGELDKARKDLEEALRRNPNVPQVHFLLGNVHFKENRLDHALAAFNRASSEVGANKELEARILKNRALVQFQMEAFEKAAADYDSAVRLAPRITKEDRYHLGLLLYAAGDEARAREAWSGLNATDLKRLRTLLDENLSPGF